MSLKVPKASITIDILNDQEYLELVDQEGGMAAFGTYVALICAAKAQRNEGVFVFKPRLISKLIKINQDDLIKALQLLQGPEILWVRIENELLTICGFEKWNPSWGGSRKGSGRKPEADKNQVESSGQLDSLVGEIKLGLPISSSISSSISTPSVCERADPALTDLSDLIETSKQIVAELYQKCPTLDLKQKNPYSVLVMKWIEEDRAGAKAHSDPQRNLAIGRRMVKVAKAAAKSALDTNNSQFATERAHKAILAIDWEK